MAQFYAESPASPHRIPKALANVAVLLEPLSIVEKGIDHSFRLQRRFLWKPRAAVVFGAGPIGPLAAAALPIPGVDAGVINRQPRSDPPHRLPAALRAPYPS